MGKNPENFFDSMQKSQTKLKEESQRGYESKILRKLCVLYDYTVSDVRNLYADPHEDEPLLELKHIVNDSLFDAFYMKKLKGQLMQSFVFNMDKTQAWKSFCALCDEHRLPMAGLVFPVKGYSDWIIHTMGMVGVPGKGRIVIPSKRTDFRDVVVEPLETFIESRKD